MDALDQLIPVPRLAEIDHVDVDASPEHTWERVRHGRLFDSPLIDLLFGLRALPRRVTGRQPDPIVRSLDEFGSSPEKPGFQVLVEDPPSEVAVGAIGRVWEGDIPFVHVGDAAAYRAFAEPDYARVAWAVRVLPRGDHGARVEVEVRIDATTEGAWERVRRYYRLIGPGSHFIRHAALARLGRSLGVPQAHENERELEGDRFLPGALAQITRGITIAARPEAIWPWLVQMGCRRGGFYSVDLLDNGGLPSAREIRGELQALAVGDVLPATPEGDDGFEVLDVVPSRALVLGGLYDLATERQLPFSSARPARCWHITWSFVLEPLDAESTRLLARARAWWPPEEALHAVWIRPVHHLMQTVQLRRLAARAEGRLGASDWRDGVEAVEGAATMLLALLTPFLRGPRSHWGLSAAEAEAPRPGDDVVPAPRWSWTHGIEIDASASDVWPWVAQVGADRGGFYSYQALENLVGCGVRNAESIHPAQAHALGDALVLHPDMPPMRVEALRPGQYLLAVARPDEAAIAHARPWVCVSWLFEVEPLGDARCRFVSRYRCDCSHDLATLVAMGPTLMEPVGFAMDRRMLMGVKERAEAAVRHRRSEPRGRLELIAPSEQ